MTEQDDYSARVTALSKGVYVRTGVQLPERVLAAIVKATDEYSAAREASLPQGVTGKPAACTFIAEHCVYPHCLNPAHRCFDESCTAEASRPQEALRELEAALMRQHSSAHSVVGMAGCDALHNERYLGKAEGIAQALGSVRILLERPVVEASRLASPPATTEDQKQELINDLWRLFTSTQAEISAYFGEARCVDDEHRCNYALELMSDFVTLDANVGVIGMKDHHSNCAAAQAWDIENVPCTCPRGWPRQISKAVPASPPETAPAEPEWKALTVSDINEINALLETVASPLAWDSKKHVADLMWKLTFLGQRIERAAHGSRPAGTPETKD